MITTEPLKTYGEPLTEPNVSTKEISVSTLRIAFAVAV
jgi:hypothetical protein